MADTTINDTTKHAITTALKNNIAVLDPAMADKIADEVMKQIAKSGLIVINSPFTKD